MEYTTRLVYIQIICKSVGKCLMNHVIMNKKLEQNTEDAEKPSASEPGDPETF